MLGLHSRTLLENKVVLSRVRASRSLLQEEGQCRRGRRLGKGLQESPGLMPLVVVSVGTHMSAPACINASNYFTSNLGSVLYWSCYNCYRRADLPTCYKVARSANL